MVYRSVAFFLSATALLASFSPAIAADASDQWKAQDTWDRYSEKETGGGFKLSKPPVRANHDSVLTPILKAPKHNDPGQSYVLMPAADPPSQQPEVRIETTLVPTVHQAPMMPAYLGSGWWGGGYGGYGGYGRRGWGGYNPWGWGYGAGNSVGYRPITKVTQTGPSKPSGNYFAPSTPDPTDSGNYYASPSGLPKAAPIIHQDGNPADYWGKNGNPLPEPMRP